MLVEVESTFPVMEKHCSFAEMPSSSSSAADSMAGAPARAFARAASPILWICAEGKDIWIEMRSELHVIHPCRCVAGGSGAVSGPTC